MEFENEDMREQNILPRRSHSPINFETFKKLLGAGSNRDGLMCQIMNELAHKSGCAPLEVPFMIVESALQFSEDTSSNPGGSASCNQACATIWNNANKINNTPVEPNNLLARIVALRVFNQILASSLPLLLLKSPQQDTAILGGMTGSGSCVNSGGSDKSWLKVPFLSNRIRAVKVSERSERAFWKTSILAMKCAKWLQTATFIHPPTTTKLTQPNSFCFARPSFSTAYSPTRKLTSSSPCARQPPTRPTTPTMSTRTLVRSRP